MQVPSVSITSIFKYSTQATPDSNEIPYAMAFDGPSDQMKDQECAICMGKLRYKPQLQQVDEDGDPESSGFDSMNEQYSSTPCNHVFHGECLKAWLTR